MERNSYTMVNLRDSQVLHDTLNQVFNSSISGEYTNYITSWIAHSLTKDFATASSLNCIRFISQNCHHS